jgi:hypothetical protein
MTKTEMQARIRILKDELNTRHKYGIVKMAFHPNGKPIKVEELQEELFSLIYRESKME